MSNHPLCPVAFVLTATNHGTMLVNRHDYRLAGDSGYGVGYQILNSSSFDASEIDLALAGNITSAAASTPARYTPQWARRPARSACRCPTTSSPRASAASRSARRRPPSSSVRPSDYAEDKLQPTQMIAIDDYGLARLDFMKIDIEGMETDALEGARHTIVRLQPVMLIERIKTNQDQLHAWLLERGYRLTALGMNTLAIHEADPTVNQLSVQVKA